MASTSKKHPFEYVAPTPKQIEELSGLRNMCKSLHDYIVELRDDGLMEPRCAAVAITNLEQVSMWGNKGIVFAETKDKDPELT